jgi:hypothetical protein
MPVFGSVDMLRPGNSSLKLFMRPEVASGVSELYWKWWWWGGGGALFAYENQYCQHARCC